MKVAFTKEDLEERQKYLGEGDHDVAIANLEYQTSQNGNKMVWVTFRSATGAEFRERLMLEGKGLWRLANLTRALGYSDEVLMSGEFDTESMRGKKLTVKRTIIGKEARDGKEYNVYENDYSPAKASASDDQIPF